MIEQTDFPLLVEQAMSLPGRANMRPVIEKELLHYDILFTLDRKGLLDKLTFQGGTSLRLCYGASRFSEDLDFAGGKNFASTILKDMKDCIEHYIGKRYDLEVSVKEPNELREEPEYAELKVDKWRISVVTTPGRKSLPKQRIKIEVANIPAYSRQPLALQQNYDFLPDGYSDTLIMTETLDEIMADKLMSLVNCQRYVRYRDIWDLRWLKQQGAEIKIEWIQGKIRDYQIENYVKKLDEMLSRLPEIIIGKDFKEEIKRFIPMDVQERTLLKGKFYDFLSHEIRGLLSDVRVQLIGGADDEFRM
jgi:predicted nucleotidyltransferase component of viral defense system